MCVCVCVRACVRVCVCVCVRASKMFETVMQLRDLKMVSQTVKVDRSREGHQGEGRTAEGEGTACPVQRERSRSQSLTE